MLNADKITLISLFVLSFVVNLALIDSYIIPKKNESDKIVAYSAIEQNTAFRFGQPTKTYLGFRFFTKKSYKFSLEQTFIENPEITISTSRIFRNVTTVYNQNGNYSEQLISGMNGINLYVFLILSISSIVSILVLTLNGNISNTTFGSIVTFHLFMIFIATVIYFMV